MTYYNMDASLKHCAEYTKLVTKDHILRRVNIWYVNYISVKLLLCNKPIASFQNLSVEMKILFKLRDINTERWYQLQKEVSAKNG